MNSITAPSSFRGTTLHQKPNGHDVINGLTPYPLEPPLLPNEQSLSQFSAAIFKRADPKGFVSLRAFPDKGNNDEKPVFIEAITLGHPQFREVLTERARQAAQCPEAVVFCPPLVTLRTAKDATTVNVFEGVVLTVECDQTPSAARSTLTGLLGEPTVVLESGGEWIDGKTGEVEPKVHIHWRLNVPTRTPADHARLRHARNMATKLVGGDASAIPLVHPLRWAGSWHRKKDPPRIAKIVFQSENEIDLADVLSRLEGAMEASGAAFVPASEHTTNDKLKAKNPADVVSALKVIPNENLAWEDWNHIGMTTWAATGGSTEGMKAFADWSAKSSKDIPQKTVDRWQHYQTSPPTKVGFGTLVFLARQHWPLWTCAADPLEVPPADPVDLWAKFDPPTLPRGVLPDVIERFAFDQGRAMGADMAGIAVSALAVCAAAIPDKIQLQVKRHNSGWLESARPWVALVGPPSSMKSPIMAAAVRPLRRIDSEMARQYSEERARYDKLPKEEKLKTEPPKQTRLLLQDTTIEAAQEILKDSPDGVLCYQDEMSGWFGSMDKYTSGRGGAKDRAFWLEAYNGGPYSVNRVTRGSVFIENLSVSLIGGIQPEPIRKLADESMDDGLLQRLLPIILKPAVEGRDEEMSPVVSEYSSLVSRLHRLAGPTPLRFDEAAQAYRQELERRHLELQSCETIHRKLAAHIGKYNGIFARLCVVWHCVESEPGNLPSVISERTARRAGAFLHGFLLPHALAFYVGTLGLSNDHDRLTAVAGYILAHKLERITNRDVQRGDQTMRGLDRAGIEAVFDQLDALGWINRVAGPRPTAPPHWIVNSAVHTKFTARAAAEAERRGRDRKMIAEMFGKTVV